MKRIPVQIAITSVENISITQCNYITQVICNDGTIWEIGDTRPEWRQLPNIPQPTNKND
jgi:hypothetical protein